MIAVLCKNYCFLENFIPRNCRAGHLLPLLSTANCVLRVDLYCIKQGSHRSGKKSGRFCFQGQGIYYLDRKIFILFSKSRNFIQLNLLHVLIISAVDNDRVIMAKKNCCMLKKIKQI